MTLGSGQPTFPLSLLILGPGRGYYEPRYLVLDPVYDNYSRWTYSSIDGLQTSLPSTSISTPSSSVQRSS